MNHQLLEHSISFTGRFVFGWSSAPGPGPRFAIVESAIADPVRMYLRDGVADETCVLQGRPDENTVRLLAERVKGLCAKEVIAVGSGALMDAAKLATHAASSDGEFGPSLIVVPCGPEPYRAVARFAVIDDMQGNRLTTVDPSFGAATVLFVPELLSALPSEVVALHVLDTLVHACESLLSTRSEPFSRLLSMDALRTIATHATTGVVESDPDARGLARVQLMVAAFQAVEAFSSTRLGLAHALASPLGTVTRRTHDSINGVLGPILIRFWGDDVPHLSDIGEVLGIRPTANAVAGAIDGYRRLAGLPDSLHGLGIAWEDVESVLGRAAQSSGIQSLPRTLDASDLERFARAAWQPAAIGGPVSGRATRG